MPDQDRPMELWGGVECTINRVGDVFFDQLKQSGHRARCESDLELFAGLGLKTLRTALHWEHFETERSWASFDRVMISMRRLGIRPIVGLVHHGSGPAATHLLDPAFPERLAAFALKVASRYPDVLDYTPVNEPQTTARFSCLYGHWYPHHRQVRSYVRALFHQIKGIVLAMNAVKRVQPEARLIHTEDGGATFATKALESYRIEREHRRWLGADLLHGLVTREHPLYSFLLSHGVEEQEILWYAHHPCPPAVLGLNYYVTSDRFLDDRLDLYPPKFAGGDTGSEPLVDIEALRVRKEGLSGAGAILKECWYRYRTPVAITEAHLGSRPEDQLLWLNQVWTEAEMARADGVDVRAVTAWALLGSYNWCYLCTQDTGAYEPGVFDVASGVPQETPLAGLVRTLANGCGQASRRDGVSQQGWWQIPSRLTYPPG